MIPIKGIIDGVRGIADDLITTEKERRELDIREQELFVRSDESQNAVNVANAGDDDKFNKRARPFILWGCGIALLYSALVEPFARFVATVIFGYTGTFPVVDTAVLEFVLYGLLGLGAMRSVDKRIPKWHPYGPQLIEGYYFELIQYTETARLRSAP